MVRINMDRLQEGQEAKKCYCNTENVYCKKGARSQQEGARSQGGGVIAGYCRVFAGLLHAEIRGWDAINRLLQLLQEPTA